MSDSCGVTYDVVYIYIIFLKKKLSFRVLMYILFVKKSYDFKFLTNPHPSLQNIALLMF